MMRLTFIFILLTTILSAQKKINGFDELRLRKLDNFINGMIQEGKLPNAAVYISKDNKEVLHKAYGYSNLELKKPLKKDDIFRIASQTKLLTSICVMMLLEDGHFTLEDPISRFIPAFANPRVLVKVESNDKTKYETRPAKSEITIRQLLTHTAGIPYEHQLEELPQFKVPYFCSMADDKLEDVVNRIAARPLVADPGTEYVYGLNTDVLGRLIEVVSKKSFKDFMMERLIKPLEMNDTYFYLPEDRKHRLVELYSIEKVGDKLSVHSNKEYRNFAIEGAQSYYSGGAGLVSTVSDYAKVCNLFLNDGKYKGKQIISRKTVELMSRNQIGDLKFWGRNDGFSLGLQVAGNDSHYLDTATPGSLTWGGMYCSEYTIDPKEKLVMMVFTNVHPYVYYGDFVRRFRNLVYQALD